MVFSSIEIDKKVFLKFDNVFHFYLMRGFQKYEKKLNSYEGFLSYLQSSTANSAHQAAYFCPALVCPQNSISSIFLESTHQVDMKNVVKCYKHVFGYFNALKTHGVKIVKFIYSEKATVRLYVL